MNLAGLFLSYSSIFPTHHTFNKSLYGEELRRWMTVGEAESVFSSRHNIGEGGDVKLYKKRRPYRGFFIINANFVC